MAHDERLTRLENCLQAVHDAAWQIVGPLDPERRAVHRLSLLNVAEAWRAFEAGLDEAQRARSADLTASLLARIGDDLFYGRGAADEAIAVFEVALSIAPNHAESLKGIIAAYLQGSEGRPERALPYAERLVVIDPSRERDVLYIRSLIAD